MVRIAAFLVTIALKYAKKCVTMVLVKNILITRRFMIMSTPSFWKTDLEYIEKIYNDAKNCTEKRVLCQSAGNRPVYMLAYGEKKKLGRANYSSALGARNKSHYCPKGQTPCVILIGAEHGSETEGVAAITNLISLLETGYDLAGKRNDSLLEAAKKVRLVLLPVANPDGRARVEPDCMIGKTFKELRYWAQGTWADGTICSWPECKSVHPIKEAAGFLGGYYNDDGVNLMHDTFYHPMARETQALLDLCANEAADFVIHLHGGGNIKGGFLATDYATKECSLAIDELYQRCQAVGDREGLEYFHAAIPGVPSGENPLPCNLVSVTHHACGAVSACYESNEGILDEPGMPTRLTHEQILRMHEIMFEECFKMAGER